MKLLTGTILLFNTCTYICRRIYQCLRDMVSKQRESGYTLAQEIALGEARCENMSKIHVHVE